MIVSSTVGRCCMAYLLLVTHATLTSSNPIPQANADDPKQRTCGTDFSNALKSVCAVYKSTWLNPSTLDVQVSEGNELNLQGELRKAENQRSGMKNECCSIGCNRKDLERYCAVVRNQTTEQLQNSQEVSGTAVTELIPQSAELLPTTEPPSDSTPEYILNESLEQEAFTILSTYRTPQYSINSLQFL